MAVSVIRLQSCMVIAQQYSLEKVAGIFQLVFNPLLPCPIRRLRPWIKTKRHQYITGVMVYNL